MHKKIFTVLIGLFLVASLTMAQGIVDNSSEPLAYINYVEGKVLFRDFQKVELNMIIQEGDEINVTDGRVEILLKGGGIIRLDANTRVVFATLADQMIVLEVWSGNIYVHARGKIEIGIKTLHKSFNLTKRGLHLIEVRENKTNDYFDPRPENDFDRWNIEREKELNRTETRYLPEELSYYESTMYSYGRWQYYDPYGYVWLPRVSYGWQPYLHGRWVWYPIIGWTWVSSEPFGWCAYHYGRWQWDIGFGWYWIPTRIWGPSWVHWYSYGGYIGWAPRWYDDHYYQRHRDRYTNIYSNVWTTIYEDQLQSRNIAKSIVSKSELQKIPRLTSRSELKTSPPSQSQKVGIISSQPRKIYSPNSGLSIQKRSSEPIRQISPTRSQDFSPRNTIFSPKSYSPRANTQFRPSPKNSIRSFLSPSRSFSRPPISQSPSRPVQKNIRKK